MQNDKIWVQRRMVQYGDNDPDPEFIFNETEIDYLKLIKREIPKENLPDYYVEDREVHGIYLGKEFYARLFRPSGHWFGGQESYGVEIAFCLSLFFKTPFLKIADYEQSSEPLLMCYNTRWGNYLSRDTRNNYCYEPARIPGAKDVLIPEGQKCSYPALIFGSNYEHAYLDETVTAGDMKCHRCPFRKKSNIVSNGKPYVQCGVPEFKGWPEDEYLNREDYYELIRIKYGID